MLLLLLATFVVTVLVLLLWVTPESPLAEYRRVGGRVFLLQQLRPKLLPLIGNVLLLLVALPLLLLCPRWFSVSEISKWSLAPQPVPARPYKSSTLTTNPVSLPRRSC